MDIGHWQMLMDAASARCTSTERARVRGEGRTLAKIPSLFPLPFSNVAWLERKENCFCPIYFSLLLLEPSDVVIVF